MKKKYSIWIMPTGSAAEILDTEIKRLAELFHFTPFVPHLTILGTLNAEESDAIAKCEQLAQKVQPFQLKSNEVSFSTTFFQNVLLRAQMSAELGSCYLTASEVCETEVGMYMPHFSLVYGNHTMSQREEIANAAQIKPFEFTVDRIHLFETNTMEYTKWREVGEYALEG